MSFRNSYGFFDRCLHRFAFAARGALLGAADLEEKMFRTELADVRAERPLFVTALPRAGTTILLELLAGTSTIATHTYRDMPFVLCPMLWAKFTRRFRRQDAPRERAHGDGIQISLDSPEAFEEVVWMAFWRRRYGGATIAPWGAVDDDEFLEFLRAHMRKVVALRRRDKPTTARYASKNNLNVARLPGLLDALPDAIALVPFRDPVQHAQSLLSQHRRFLELHRKDRFARRYMRGIGHFDFGDHLKPIDFDGWFSGRDVAEASSLSFWLEYWCATYRHVLSLVDRERLYLVSFEALGAAPDLGGLATALELDPAELQAGAKILRPAPVRDVDLDGVPTALVEQANQLHAALSPHCVLG